MNNSAYDAVRGNALVKGLSPAQLESFYNAGEKVSVAPGEILIQEGQGSKFLYLVLSGKLEIYHPDIQENFTLALCDPGHYVGEYALIDSEPASATVKVTQPSEFFKIGHDSLKLLFKSDSDMGQVVYRNLLTNLVNRLRMMDREFDNFLLTF